MISSGLHRLERLESINKKLALLLGEPAAKFSSSSQVCERDLLLICGIVGGKDVGKSTLINALAQKKISEDKKEIGEGTAIPIAYVHRDDSENLKKRFGNSDGQEAIKFKVFEHSQDDIRGLVLVDLPDIDSRFPGHRERSREAIERADRVIWLLTPQGADDREIAKWVREVIRATASSFCVMNKFDLTLQDEPREPDGGSFWEARRRWLLKTVVRSLKLDVRESQVYMLAAAHDSPKSFCEAVEKQWGNETPIAPSERQQIECLAERTTGDLNQLRKDLLTPVPVAEVQRIKRDNVDAQVNRRAEQILRHFQLEARIEGCKLARELVEKEFERQFDDDFVTTVAQRLRGMTRPPSELAHDVMDRRVPKWPELAVLYWPIARLLRFASRWVIPGWSSERFEASDLHQVSGMNLRDRADVLSISMNAHLAHFPPAVRSSPEKLDLSNEIKRVEAQLAEIPARREANFVSLLTISSGRPSRLARGGIWFILLWYPFVQPVLVGLLQMASMHGVRSALQAATTIVLALGAGTLFKGLTAVAAIYCAILAIMYARAVRDVSRKMDLLGEPESKSEAEPDDGHASEDHDARKPGPQLNTEGVVYGLLSEGFLKKLEKPIKDFIQKLEECLTDLNELSRPTS